MTDTERLDWIEKQCEWAHRHCQSGSGRHYIDLPIRVDRDFGVYLWGYDPKPSIREAIDTAMQSANAVQPAELEDFDVHPVPPRESGTINVTLRETKAKPPSLEEE